MSRLAGLGIQVSRSTEETEAGLTSRLSGLGVSVSGGPRPSFNNAPRLPPGINVSGGPPRPSLPPGISVSGGPTTDNSRPSGVSISGGQQTLGKPSLPPGVSISGGNLRTQTSNGAGPRGSGTRPNSFPGVSSNNDSSPKPKQPQIPNEVPVQLGPRATPGVRLNSQSSPRPQALRPTLPPGISVSQESSPRHNLPPGISVNQGTSPTPQAQNGAHRPSLPPVMNSDSTPKPLSPSDSSKLPSPRPNVPPAISINSDSSSRLPASNGADLIANLPSGVSTNSGPRTVKVSGQGARYQCVPPGVGPTPKQSPTQSESLSPATEERSESPEETMSMIAGFLKDTKEDNSNKSEPEMENEELRPKQNEDKSGEAEKKSLKEPGPKADEESMEIDENLDNQDKQKRNVDISDNDDKSAEKKKVTDGKTEDSQEEPEETQNTENTDSSKPKEGDQQNEESENADNTVFPAIGKEKDPEESTEAGDGEEENWEEYDEYDGEDGYEGYEGYEGDEDFEGYEGEDGWEGYEEETEETEETVEKTGVGVGEKEKETQEKRSAEDTVVNDEVTGDKKNDESMYCDDDGAPKQLEEEKTVDEESSATPASSGSRQSQDEDGSAIIPSSMSPVPILPPGISISSPSGKGSSSAPPTNLPPGISISPFKKPSTSSRQSVDDDARSQDSRDCLEDCLPDSVSIRSLREGEAPAPLVGTETECVFCREKCTTNNPKLLTCLMSSCASCFSRRIRDSIRDNSANDVVDLDGNDIQMAPEVTCTVCNATTSEDEVMDNVFAAIDPREEEAEAGEEQRMCHSCEENSVATHHCEEEDEYLCSDCVRAYQRVKMTKDYKFTQLKVTRSGQSASLSHLNYCPIHRNEKLTLYCETCDKLNCRDCQLSEQCRNHKYRYSYEVAPEVKAHLMQSISDIKLKRSGLEESRQILTSKISDVNARENSMLSQMTEMKNKMVAKIESRHRELCTEISKICREKRKILEGRKSMLDRTFWQADYSINFVDHLLSTSVSDEKILLTKRMMYRQMKRMRRANNAVGLTPLEMELKLDLYFQHFSSQALHTNLDNVLKMVMGDIKVSQIPIEAPKPKPPPQPAQAQPPPQPSPVRQPPVTPNRGLPGSPQARLSSPARINAGMVSRQLSTPTKHQQVIMNILLKIT